MLGTSPLGVGAEGDREEAGVAVAVAEAREWLICT